MKPEELDELRKKCKENTDKLSPKLQDDLVKIFKSEMKKELISERIRNGLSFDDAIKSVAHGMKNEVDQELLDAIINLAQQEENK
jgi:hypothetical protein